MNKTESNLNRLVDNAMVSMALLNNAMGAANIKRHDRRRIQRAITKGLLVNANQ